MSESCRRFRRLRDADPEYPIYVQNATQKLIEWKMYDEHDFLVREHPNRRWRNIFCIWPEQVVNLRDIMSEQAFHFSITLSSLLDREILIVLNKACWGYDPDDDPEIPALKKLAENPPPKRSARYYAVLATRRKYECKTFD